MDLRNRIGISGEGSQSPRWRPSSGGFSFPRPELDVRETEGEEKSRMTNSARWLSRGVLKFSDNPTSIQSKKHKTTTYHPPIQ